MDVFHTPAGSHTNTSPPRIWYSQQAPQDISTLEYSIFRGTINEFSGPISDLAMVQPALLRKQSSLGTASLSLPELNVREEEFNTIYRPSEAPYSGSFSEQSISHYSDLATHPKYQAANINLSYSKSPQANTNPVLEDWKFCNSSGFTEYKPQETGLENFCLKLACYEDAYSRHWMNSQDPLHNEPSTSNPFFEPEPEPAMCESNSELRPPTSVETSLLRPISLIQGEIIKEEEKLIEGPNSSFVAIRGLGLPVKLRQRESHKMITQHNPKIPRKQDSKDPKLREKKSDAKTFESFTFQLNGKGDNIGNITKKYSELPPSPQVTLRRGTKERGHKCIICNKVFERPSSYRIHYTIHSGVKGHKCKICGREFNVKSNLTRHERLHRAPITSRINFINGHKR